MNIRKKAVKGVFWSAIQHWGSQTISFIVFSLLARLLEPEGFGLVALASVFIAFMEIFLDQGLTQAIVQRDELDPQHLDTAFWTNLSVGILLTAFGITFADAIANLFNHPQLAPIIQWLSLSFLLGALSRVQQANFHRQLVFKVVAVRSLVATFVGGAVGVVMAFSGFGVWSLVGQRLANESVGVLVLWGASDWRPKFNVSAKHFKELFAFGINMVGFNIVNFFNRRADDFLIGYFLGPVALGYYTVAYRILWVMTQLLVTVTSQVALPTFSRLQKEPEKLQSAFYTVTQFTSLIAFPSFVGVAVLAPELVQVLFGSKWQQSIPVMQALAFIGILHSMLYFNSTVMMAKGKPSWRFGVNCLNAVVNVIAFALVTRWGILAVAIAYVMSGYLIFPISIYLVRKLIPLQLITYLSRTAIPLAGTLVMAVAILAAKHLLDELMNSTALLIVGILIGAFTYILTIFLIAPKIISQILDFIQLNFSKRNLKI